MRLSRGGLLLLCLAAAARGARGQGCAGFAGMQFYVSSRSGDLSVVPANQNPGDIGLCAENSALSDSGVTMFFRTSRRRLLDNASHEIEQPVARRSAQGLARCVAPSGNVNIGPFPLAVGEACVDGPPWCSSEVGLSYYIEFSNSLTTVSVWHCCRPRADGGCGEIVSSSSFSTTPMATPGPPPTPSPSPAATPSPTPSFAPQPCSAFSGMAFFVTASPAGLQVAPSNQNPGDIGLCAENSPLSDRNVTMFYRTIVRRRLGGGGAEGDSARALAYRSPPNAARSMQSGFLRCIAPSG